MTIEIGRGDAARRAADLHVTFPGGVLVRRAADGPFVIGREAPADLCIEHPAVSRLHLQIWPGRRWEAIDFDSRNGTFVGGRRLYGGVAIEDGMMISLASPDGVELTFSFVRTAAPEPAELDGPTAPLAWV